MHKNAQDLKIEIQSIKKTQTEGILGKETETTDASITNRIQETEERNSGI